MICNFPRCFGSGFLPFAPFPQAVLSHVGLVLVHLQLFPPFIPYHSLAFSLQGATHFLSFLESSISRLQSCTPPLNLENSR